MKSKYNSTLNDDIATQFNQILENLRTAGLLMLLIIE